MGEYSFRDASWLVTSMATTANAGGLAWACNVWIAAPPIAGTSNERQSKFTI